MNFGCELAGRLMAYDRSENLKVGTSTRAKGDLRRRLITGLQQRGSEAGERPGPVMSWSAANPRRPAMAGCHAFTLPAHVTYLLSSLQNLLSAALVRFSYLLPNSRGTVEISLSNTPPLRTYIEV